MKYDFLGVIVFGIVLLIGVAVIAAFITVGIFLIRALSRYVKSGNVRKEKSSIKKSLGEVLKQHLSLIHIFCRKIPSELFRFPLVLK